MIVLCIVVLLVILSRVQCCLVLVLPDSIGLCLFFFASLQFCSIDFIVLNSSCGGYIIARASLL